MPAPAQPPFENAFAGQRVLITGVTGFKGSWLATWLHALGAEVHGLANGVPSDPALFEVGGVRALLAGYHAVDVRDKAAVAAAFEAAAPDLVFHLAAQALVSVSYSDPVETLSTNVLGTAHVLDALRHCRRPCQAVIITSDKCYENVEQVWGYRESDRLGGKDIYSASKGAAELVFYSYFHAFFARQDTVRIASARAGNVIGGGDWARDRIVVDCMQAWSAGKPVTLRRPQATRPWQHVLEPLSGYLTLAKQLRNDPGLHGESFNFGPPAQQNKTVLELLRALSRGWGFASEAQAFEVESQDSFHEAGLLKLTCDKALAQLDWEANLNFEETASMTSNWYYAFYAQEEDMVAYTREDIARYLARATERRLSWAVPRGSGFA